MTRPCAARALVTAALAALLLGPTASPAQLPHLDPMPWFAPADSTVRRALVVDLDRYHDDASDWTMNRLQLTVTMPAGEAGAWFLRGSYLRLDTGSHMVGERWPDALGTEAAVGWPGERISNGFGALEAGITGPLRLPFLGSCRFAAGVGLPSGMNRVYPFSSTSLPLRFQLRRGLDLGGPRLWLQGGGLAHMDASGDELADTSFPSGYTLGAEAAWYRGPGSRWTVGYDFEDRDGRPSHLVTAALWVPWRDDTSVGLRLRRELAGDEHRPAAWYATISVRFEGTRPEEPEDESGP